MKSLPISSSPRMSTIIRRVIVALVPSALAMAFAALALPAVGQANRAAAPAKIDRAAAAPAQPAAAQAQPAPQISAPMPVAEQASLNNPFSDSNSPFAADQESAPAQSFVAPAHAHGPHHTLGKTMAIFGTVALGFGAASYTVANQHCKSFNSGICSQLHTAGLALMPAGGAVAGVGFYWEFQKPKQ